MAGPRQLVEAPSFAPLPYGLLAVVNEPGSDGSHWQNGITYFAACEVDGGTTYDECIAITGTGGTPPPPPSKADNVASSWRGATPFTVYAEFDCSPVGMDVQAEAEAALARSEQWQVERAFWTGIAANQQVVYPRLAEDAEVVESGTGIVLATAASIPATGAHDVVCGLGLLEQALADCGGSQGVIHVPRKALPALRDLIIEDGDHYRTLNGNLVAVGSGYPGTGPAGQAVTGCQTWFFATGMVDMRRSEVFTRELRESIDRAENTVKAIAERTYLFNWGCCHAAILVDLNEPV